MSFVDLRQTCLSEIKACDPVYCSHKDLRSEPLLDAGVPTGMHEEIWINMFPF